MSLSFIARGALSFKKDTPSSLMAIPEGEWFPCIASASFPHVSGAERNWRR